MPIPKSTGFSGLSKATTTKPGSLLDQAKADVKAQAAPPVKTRAQALREEAEAAEREEAAAAAQTEPAELFNEVVHEAIAAPEIVKAKPVAVKPAVKAAPVAAKPAPAPTTRAVAAPVAGGFGLSTERKKMASALMAFVEVAEQSRAPSLFATLECTGGEGGGLWSSPKWQDQEVAQTLPQGKVVQKLFYLGYRLSLVIWPSEYKKGGDKVKPIAAGIITGSDPELCAVATRAAKNFQFTKREKKDRFDIANGGPGRPSMGVEIVGYMPNTDRAGNVVDGGQIVVLQGVSNYGAAARTLGELALLVDPETQEIANLPMNVAIATAQESSAAQAWPTHYFTFATDATSSGVAVAQSFEAFKESAMQDAELMAKFEEWMTGGDRKLGADDIEKLKIAASL